MMKLERSKASQEIPAKSEFGAIDSLAHALLLVVQQTVEQKVEELFPATTQASDISVFDPAKDHGDLVDALEIGKLLGRDTSTPDKARAAKLYVYNLARQNLIPCVRISPRRIMFNVSDIRRVISNGGNAQPYRVA